MIVNIPGEEPYDVRIGAGVLDALGARMRGVPSLEQAERVLVVTDENVAPLYRDRARESLASAGFRVSDIVVPAGEDTKSVEVASEIWEAMAQLALGRDCAVVALGGGVVGDLAGFVASTYMRGIPFVQVPTSLLAMVDSSVGGKTGVDLPEGKNLVGAFYQPRLVLIDPNVLTSLPDSTFADGMAEVVKYGCISNREILTMVSQPDYKSNIENIIYECVKIKRDVVAIDEHDTGLRMILNFGHTIGHAAEKLGNYTDLTHGQAVAIGMVAAMRLSALLGNEDLTAPLIDLLKHIGLPTELNYDRESIFNALLSDKKKFGATVNFILVREAGRAEITPIDAEKLHEYVLKL